MLARTSPGFAAIAATPPEIFRFLADAPGEGRRAVLVTMTALVDSSPRPLGAHMAVREDGHYAGSFSGGCVEAAIVAEALDALAAGECRTVRFGAGSDYIDIRLPCGGAMDLHFLPDPAAGTVADIVALFDSRHPATIAIGRDGGLTEVKESSVRSTGWSAGRFLIRHVPSLRLVVIGHGAESLALARLARTYGAQVELTTPDSSLLSIAEAEGLAGAHLSSPSAPLAFAADRWTAVALLFHDHDWESELLRRALATPAFWIGAMGSPRTHAFRIAALAAEGVPADALARIRGPIGLIPAARDPATLALSALAEIATEYDKSKA